MCILFILFLLKARRRKSSAVRSSWQRKSIIILFSDIEWNRRAEFASVENVECCCLNNFISLICKVKNILFLLRAWRITVKKTKKQQPDRNGIFKLDFIDEPRICVFCVSQCEEKTRGIFVKMKNTVIVKANWINNYKHQNKKVFSLQRQRIVAGNLNDEREKVS